MTEEKQINSKKIDSMLHRLDNLVGELLKEDEECAHIAVNAYIMHMVDHSLKQMLAVKKK